jgi:hypothetical protein
MYLSTTDYIQPRPLGVANDFYAMMDGYLDAPDYGQPPSPPTME